MTRHGSISKGAAVIFAAVLLVSHGCGGDGGDDDAGDMAKGSAKVSILFSSDMLGKIRSCGCTIEDSGGLGRRMTYTEETRSGSREVLVLDAGDAFSFDLSFSKREAELALEAYSMIGVDVFTPGETDFIFGLPFLKSAAENAGFEMIAANVIDSGTGRPVFGREYTVRTLEGGLRVAITGVLDEAIRFPAYIDRSGFEIAPAEATLEKLAPRMRKDADFLVLLSHMGMERTKEMLSRIEGFDIAVIGHGKPLLKKNETVGGTLLLATGGLGQYIGRVDMELSPSEGMRYGRMRLIPLPDEIAIHPEIVELFRAYGVPLTDKEAGSH